MECRRQNRLSSLITELHTNEEKVTLLKTKRDHAKEQIRQTHAKVKKIQTRLDKAMVKHRRKVKTFQLLDEILAEFKLAVKQKAELKTKAAKATKQRKAKTAEQAIADAMSCLDALPEAQRQAVLDAMKDKL